MPSAAGIVPPTLVVTPPVALPEQMSKAPEQSAKLMTNDGVPAVKAAPGSGVRQKVLGLAGRFVLWLERTIGKAWAPFVADGLIVTARSTR